MCSGNLNLKLTEPFGHVDMASTTLPEDRSTTLMPENCLESRLNLCLKPTHDHLRAIKLLMTISSECAQEI